MARLSWYWPAHPLLGASYVIAGCARPDFVGGTEQVLQTNSFVTTVPLPQPGDYYFRMRMNADSCSDDWTETIGVTLAE
ncbi:MAG: hypothetical protein F4174_11480 [Acidobacteria bacterium]|nr:hypothetical protein [Acidobacteriota bacterium]